MTSVTSEQGTSTARRTTGGRPADGRQRVIDAAVAQFAEYGVEGTSLQMIADAMGVTKAAVYYHFKTKDEIVVAVVTPVLDQLLAILREAEAQRGQAARTRAFLTAFTRLVIGHRQLLTLLYDDVAVLRILHEHWPHFDEFERRVPLVLVGPDADAGRLVAAAVALTGIVAAAASPQFTHLGDAELEEHLLDAGLRLVGARRRR
ncbi:TetR/AcrR family transcriptional regulator [Cryptosporangium aurantiacum]|uniref:Transcriptional regulator, TetR family n=1 Tax=Cryptosporangium aurantiacum TaxID=134849 RepID=A0A1M7TXU9_9ACTN|nr:TetR/AcrR family transcriptional regulator [Cryptosporangium aurantiacum]SHN75520.1 transcriptional regulator, TetR family [Cryptosporangium aurantiacum]